MIVEYSQKGKIHGSRNGALAQPGQQTPDAVLAGAAPGAEGQQMTPSSQSLRTVQVVERDTRDLQALSAEDREAALANAAFRIVLAPSSDGQAARYTNGDDLK